MTQEGLFDTDATIEILVSTRSAWQRFHGCEPEYIRDVCHGRCCDAPSRPGGTLVTIHRSEEEAIRARGGEVANGRLVTDGKCTFKTNEHLCSLHFTPDKPFGCIASPFTLSPNGRTLVVRNRYRALRCYEATAARAGEDVSRFPPAYEAFYASLVIIFGEATAARIRATLDHWGDARQPGYRGPDAYPAAMPRTSWNILKSNDEAKHDTPQ